MKRKPSFLIKTLGCRVNQAESNQIAVSLKEKGWREGKPPDLVVINACCVTQKAEKETRQTTRALRRKYPSSFLVITGCAVNYWQMKGELPDLSADLFLENEKKMAIPNLDFPKVSTEFHLGGGIGRTPRVFLKVQEGCNQFCSYCLVPYLRGRSRSKKPEEVIKEIRVGEEKGVQEVILCGINLADYQPSLVGLLKQILQQTRVPRIRLGSVNLSAFRSDLIDLWQDSRLCPHFHIPLQSACNQILKRMGRSDHFEEFRKIIGRLHRRIPRVNITTDLMVGFPGETDNNFRESLKNLESLRGLVSKLHVFRYSQRPGTRAARMESQIAERVKKERARKMRELSRRMKEEFAKKFVGRKLTVLFEKKKGIYWQGLSENYLWVKSRGQRLRGRIEAVKIKREKGGELYGRVEVNREEF